jgi:superfamily II DNA or RNA helicase
MHALRIAFDRGTLRLDGPKASEAPGAVWDARVSAFRYAGYRYADLLAWARHQAILLLDTVRTGSTSSVHRWRSPNLRPYQEEALRAFHAFGSRGVAVLPTGSGKTMVAIAALAHARVPALVLCPTVALVEQWTKQLQHFYSGPVGVVADGTRQVEAVTVMTFESAYRWLDTVGALFGAVVVDEVHHFAGGLRAEALEMCVAPIRLGLTATAPDPGSAGRACLNHLVGPIVCEVSFAELAGTHLAELEVIRLRVRLLTEERAEYERLRRPFAEMRRALLRAHPGIDWASIVRTVAISKIGQRAVADYHRAVAVATLPRQKRAVCADILERHRGEKTLVFTASVADAYTVALEHLVPVLSAHTGRAERTQILERFRTGVYEVLVSARVLNEGIDVPDARVCVVLGGRLGTREHVQRIGRVLRPAPGKRAILYELITSRTVDDARARSRWTTDAPHPPPRL